MEIISVKINQVKIPTRKPRSSPHPRKTRIHIFHNNETILENISTRFIRPSTTYRKELIPSILEQLKLPKETKVKWSQFAGCSQCPCSPGFIVEGDFEKDVFVTVK